MPLHAKHIASEDSSKDEIGMMADRHASRARVVRWSILVANESKRLLVPPTAAPPIECALKRAVLLP